MAKSKNWEIILGISILSANIARNFANLGESSFGLVDMLIAFITLSITFYGLKALRFFILPSIYILILIIGYQLEFSLAEVRTLEVWQANLMASMMQSLGVNTIVFGNIVGLYGTTAIFFQVAGPCTGIKGILSYGSLSTMTILDIKTKITRIILIIGIGFSGTFLVNLARLALIFLAAHYIGIEIALAIHTYLGYGLFIVWVLIFWTIAFKYLVPKAAAHQSQNSYRRYQIRLTRETEKRQPQRNC